MSFLVKTGKMYFKVGEPKQKVKQVSLLGTGYRGGLSVLQISLKWKSWKCVSPVHDFWQK